MDLNQKINTILHNIKNKEFKTVINKCEKLVSSKVENTIIYNLYGLAYQNLGLYEKSIPKFEKSIELQKNNYFALNNLAISLKAIEEYNLSEMAYKKCLKIKPDYSAAIINYANLKELLNQFEDSIKLYLSLFKFKSEVAEEYVFSKLSTIYLNMGNILKAKEYALKIKEKNPKSTIVYELLGEVLDFKKNKKYILEMENLLKNQNLNDTEKLNLIFPLGKAHDSLKNFKLAFEYFSLGNKIKKNKINYNAENIQILSKSIKSFFQNIDLYKIDKLKSEKKIIFICGMPRSGTTLIEQIISSHKEILATGEENYLSSYISKNFLKNFSLQENKIINQIHSKENYFQDYVLDRLNKNRVNKKIFTDKSVQNFLWIGFIKIFFPNSKIIFTDRNPKDVCLSIYKINFKNGFMNFAYDQKDISSFYNIYYDLYKFWKKIFNREIYTVKYENLINNSHDEIKKIINYCELDWDPNCLNHTKNSSGIKTASTIQARKPIYKSSKNLYINYSDYLKEMFDALDS